MASIAKRSKCVLLQRKLNSSLAKRCVTTLPQENKDALPPIKPKYPEGSWYTYSSRQAWKWYEDVEAINRLPTIEERLYHNVGSKNQFQYFNISPFYSQPEFIEFHEDITKSCLDSNVRVGQSKETSLSSAKWDSIAGDIHSAVKQEYKHILRQADKSSTKQEWEIVKKKLLLNTIMNRLTTILSAEASHLIHCDVDTDVNVQTHWIRGSERTPPKTSCQVGGVSHLPIRYGYWHPVDYQFRNHLPLCTHHLEGVESQAKPLDPTPPEEVLNSYAEYHRNQIDKSHDGSFNPSARGLQKVIYSLPHQPGFTYGAPAEYVNLSVLTPAESWRNDSVVNHSSIESQRGTKLYEETLVKAGMVNSFATAYAMAHYHGYGMHHDLVSPLLTQTLVFDGKSFTCVTYQLNTLRLFVHDIDNSRYNGYSHSETMELFHSITDEGGLIGLNPTCVKMVGKCILGKLSPRVTVNPHLSQEQMKTPSSGDIFPYLPKYPQFQDLPMLEHESAPIPSFIRYNRAEAPLSEWDTHPDVRARRWKEKVHEHEFTKGPLSDRAEPPSRGKTKLDLHLAKVRKTEKEKRIKWRDEVIEYKKSQEKKES